MVLLSGEAGIGKSRLLRVVREQVAREAYTCLEGRCTPYDQHSAWYPLLAPLARLRQWGLDDTPAVQLATLQQMVQQCSLLGADIVPSLAVLLGLPFPSPPARLPLEPQEQRQQMLAALLALLVSCAAQRPLLLILEDLHWGDPSTLELLDCLVDHDPTAAIYTLVTCRPPFQPAWLGRAHVTPLVLDRLARLQAETMVRHVAGQAALPGAVLQHLVAHTDGVPLFIEELTKAVLESGALQAQTRQVREAPTGTGVGIPVTRHLTQDRFASFPGKITA